MNKSASVQKVVEYINTSVSEGIWSAGSRLPSTRELARLIHVNIHTIGKALRVLSQGKVITIIQGRGIFVGAAPADTPVVQKVPKLPTRSWRRIRMQLEHDIFGDIFGQECLPQISLLIDRYGVCYQTIRKACEALAAEGVLAYRKNRYTIVGKNLIASSASILSISHSATKRLSLYNDFIQDAIAALQAICPKYNLGLNTRGYEVPSTGAWDSAYLLPDLDDRFGYIVWTASANDCAAQSLLDLLVPTGKPIAIIDEFGGFTLRTSFSAEAARRIRVFTPAGFTAGTKIGRYLIRKKHTRIAYISCYHDQAWSQIRLRGITEAYTNAGLCSCVVPFVCNTVTNEDFKPDTVQQDFVNRTRQDFTRLFPATSFLEMVQMESVLNRIETDEYFNNQILWKRLFDQTLAEASDATAWVCANDSLAVMAINFLQKTQPASIRDKISIVGFDDLPVATELEFTSYNFAPSLIMEKAVGFIINPQQEFYKNKVRIEVEGILVERGSSKTELTRQRV